jgi:F-type H+-transporting ATPase subunit b
MLEINPAALLVQIANFLVLVFLLNKFLFKPIRTKLAERAQKLEGLSEIAEGFETQAMTWEKDIREGRDASKREGLAEKERLKSEAQAKERKLIEEAMEASDRKVGDARKQAQTSIPSIRQALDLQVTALSRDVAARILGRSLS